MGREDTPASLLDRVLGGNAGRPLLTFYDDATGERVELSVATFANWVAKTANLLQHELGTEPGDRLGVLLPAHWQAAVWVMAGWSAGLAVTPDPGDVRVVATGPESLDRAVRLPGAEVVACSLRPLGGRFPGALPGGVHDYAAEVPGQADHFRPYQPVDARREGWLEGRQRLTLGELVSLAQDRTAELRLPAGARILTTAPPAALSGALDAVLMPLVLDGSAVLVRHPDPARMPDRRRQERLDADLTLPPP